MTQTEYKGSLFKRLLRHQVKVGEEMAADPANANLPELALRVTTLDSHWFTQLCTVCGNKFREGDRVRVCPDCGRAYHDDAQFTLHCWQAHFASEDVICHEVKIDPRFYPDPEDLKIAKAEECTFRWDGRFPNESAENSAARDAAYKTTQPDHIMVKQFVAGLELEWRPFGLADPFKVNPGHDAIGHECPICGFKIRAGDWVVKCPCGKCETYFHQDIFRHLECWNVWNDVDGKDYCPNTGTVYGTNADGQ